MQAVADDLQSKLQAALDRDLAELDPIAQKPGEVELFRPADETYDVHVYAYVTYE
jgi:hypothetical protein